MADSACGLNRQPIDPNWSQETKDCEKAAWELFEDQCTTCTGPLCVGQLYSLYINTRAQCLEGSSASGCGGCG